VANDVIAHLVDALPGVGRAETSGNTDRLRVADVVVFDHPTQAEVHHDQPLLRIRSRRSPVGRAVRDVKAADHDVVQADRARKERRFSDVDFG
jgi:hypothetical protein